MIPSRTRSKNEYSKIYVYLKRSLFVYILFTYSAGFHLYFFSYLCFKLLIKVWQEGKDSHDTFVLLLLKRGKSANNGKINGALFIEFFSWRLHYFLRLFVVVSVRGFVCLLTLVLKNSENWFFRLAILTINSLFFFVLIFVYVTKREREFKDIRWLNITKQILDNNGWLRPDDADQAAPNLKQ